MADSTLRKYIWLINTILDARKITFKEISDKWDISTLNYKGTELSKRTFHTARHSYAVIQISLGTDIYTVSKMLTHKNVTTTQIYADLVNSKKRETANKISLK